MKPGARVRKVENATARSGKPITRRSRKFRKLNAPHLRAETDAGTSVSDTPQGIGVVKAAREKLAA